MDIKSVIEDIRKFIDLQVQKGNNVSILNIENTKQKLVKKYRINVDYNGHKEIILQEETHVELGGMNNLSFSLIYPLHLSQLIRNNQITIIGPQIDEISVRSIDFGLFALIGFEKISEKEFDELRHLSFISNGIEGFMIRTIPRRFWCRINSEISDNFTLEFFGNAIVKLYKEKFGDIIKSMEIIFITEGREAIKEFIEITSPIREDLNSKWQDKITEWKKRLDCEYDWECGECPYEETCDDVKEVLEERNKIND